MICGTIVDKGCNVAQSVIQSCHQACFGKTGKKWKAFTASAFRKLPSIYAFSYFPFGLEGRMWDLIVSVPDHCLSFYFVYDDCPSHGAFFLLPKIFMP